MMHRHQLDGGHAEQSQMVERRLHRQRLIGAAQACGNRWMEFREASHVHLVDDGIVPGRSGRAVVAPGECRIDHGRQRRECGVVARIEREIAIGMADFIPEHLVGPPECARYRLRVWIQNNLVRVETMARGRIIRSVYPITVELVRACVR